MENTDKQIQEQAEKYADSIVPNPSKYDAPFHTTRDRHDDITQTWEDCAKWMQENKKAVSTKREAKLTLDTHIATIKLIERNRNNSLENVNKEYYNVKSNHYRDNERYSWAIKSINQTFDDELKEVVERLLTP